MQYIIHVSGNVSDVKNKTYIVNSSSEEEAKKVASQNFNSEFASDGHIVDVTPHKRTQISIASFIFILLALFLTLISWKDGHNSVSIRPDLISVICATVVCLAFFFRFKLLNRTGDMVLSIVSFVLITLLFASFIKAIIITKTIHIPGLPEFTLSTNVILPVVLFLSWLGLKGVSLACMGLISVTALCNIATLNNAMGNWGPIYLLCAVVGIILYMYAEPTFQESMYRFRNITARGLNSVKSDITVLQSKKNNNKNTNTIDSSKEEE